MAFALLKQIILCAAGLVVCVEESPAVAAVPGTVPGAGVSVDLNSGRSESFFGMGIQWDPYAYPPRPEAWRQTLERLDFARPAFFRVKTGGRSYCLGFAAGQPRYVWTEGETEIRQRLGGLLDILDYAQSHHIEVLLGEWSPPGRLGGEIVRRPDDPRWAQCAGLFGCAHVQPHERTERRLVDLPGYGFAEGARKDSARFNQAVARYLKHRANLCLVFALIESGLPPQELDVAFVEWLARHAVPFVLVFTKTDKLPSAAAQANMAAFTERIAAWFAKPPAMFACSAETGHGRQDLLGIIEEMITAIQAEANQVPVSPEGPSDDSPGRKKTRKRGPDLNRPW